MYLLFKQVLCKPKILPLKSVTLEKLEHMQKEASWCFYHQLISDTIVILQAQEKLRGAASSTEQPQ